MSMQSAYIYIYDYIILINDQTCGSSEPEISKSGSTEIQWFREISEKLTCKIGEEAGKHMRLVFKIPSGYLT